MRMFSTIYSAVTGRAGKWPRVRKTQLDRFPRCVWCNQKAETVHHVIPFHEDRSKELDPNNLASMCDRCHFVIGHMCNWQNINKLFWACISLITEAKQGVQMSEPSQFSNAGRTFIKDDHDPVLPQPVPESTPAYLEIGPNLTRILGALIAILLVLSQAYAIYLNREVKAGVEEARNEGARSLLQSEKNGMRLKKITDDKLKDENKHRAMIGLPLIKSEFDNE